MAIYNHINCFCHNGNYHCLAHTDDQRMGGFYHRDLLAMESTVEARHVANRLSIDIIDCCLFVWAVYLFLELRKEDLAKTGY